MNENIAGKTKIGIFWKLILKIPYEFIRFAISIYVARILDPKDFGIISIATILIFYANTLTNFGFCQALIQKKEIKQGHVDSVFTFSIFISIISVILFNIFAGWISDFFNSPESKDVIQIFSWLFLILAFNDIHYTLFRRDVKYKMITIVDTVKELCISLLTLCLAILGYSYWSIVIGRIIPTIVAAGYLVMKSQWKPRLRFNIASIKDLYEFSLWNFLNSQAYFLGSRIDRIVIGQATHPAALGLFDKAKSLCQMPIDSIALNINAVLFSSFSRLQDDIESLKALLSKSILMIAIINLPIFIGINVISEHFVYIFLGEKWAEVIPLLKILAIGGMFNSFNGLFATYNIGVGNYKRYTIIVILATIIFTAESLFLVEYGLKAVALGCVIYYIIHLVMSFDIIRKTHHVSIKNVFESLWPAIFCSATMYVATYYTSKIFANNYRLRDFVIIVIVGIASYCMALIVVPSKAFSDIKSAVIMKAKTMIIKEK